MNKFRILILAIAPLLAAQADASTYALSPDGVAVVRLTSSTTVAASDFDRSLLPAGYTVTAAGGGSLALTTYEAGFTGGGGGHIEALYTPAGAIAAGSRLRWIQVGRDNDPIPGYPSPYLDTHLPAGNGVFYDWAGSTSPLPSGALPFYDYSQRPSSHLSATNPITWNATLFPTVVDANKHVEVHDGVNWGWTMKKAPVGDTAGTFTDPTPGSAVVSGVGTSSFSWGTGEPSSLSFASTTFDTTPGTKFKIGTLTFHNGTIDATSGADSVDFNAAIHFTNIPELNFSLKTKLTLVNTPNVAGDPQASADQVSLGSYGYTFNVLEGATASVDVMATLNTSLAGSPGAINANGADYAPTSLTAGPTFTLGDISLVNPTGGGFISQVPEPTTGLLMLAGLGALWNARRARRGANA